MECGDTVQFYLAAERNGSSSDGDIFNNSSLYELDYALWPMYYSQPPEFTAEFINAHLAEFLDVLPYEQLNELFSHCGYSAEYLAELGYPAVRPADFPDNVLNNLLTELLAEFIYPTSNPPFTYEYTLNQTHDWTAWEVTMQSTCSTFGKESRSCNNCGATEERSLTTLNPTNHSGGSHWEEDPSATCTTAGINKLKCYGCSVVLDTNPIPATGHSMGSWYTYKDSTCHTYGTERNNCLECNYYDERSLTTYNSSNHSGGSHWEEDPSATCTTAGINKLKCYGCYAVLDTASIPETGHSMGSWYTVTASTCDTNGTKRRDCSKCSYYEEGSLDVLVHNMSAWSVTTLATCCTPGDKVRYCTRSGCSYSENSSLPLNPNNHSGGTYWTVTTTATCTTSGIRSQICYGCSAVLSTQPIAALGHNWGSWIYQYRYYDEDLQYYVRVYKRTCSRCGTYEYDYLE